MKRIIIVLIAAVALSSCREIKYGAFVVSGKVENAPMPLLYLEHLPFDNNGSMAVMDSIKLGTDGTYQLKGSGIEEGLYALTFNHQPAIIFLNDNKSVTINFDINDFRHPDITNSDGTKSLYEFINDFRAKDSAFAHFYSMADSLRGIPGMDSMIKVFRTQGNKQVSLLNDAIRNFIQQSNHPAAIFFAQDKAKSFMQPEELNKIAIASADKFKEHSGLAIFKSIMAQYIASSQRSSPAGYGLLNQPAPELRMNDVNGKPLSISSFKGKYLLVDFWASWCVPCRHENPNVVAAYHKFKNKNFDILGVSLDTDKAAWIEAIKKDGLAWNQVSDFKQWESPAVTTYQFDGIPFNVLIDPEGKIIASSLRGEALNNKLAEVLK